jgi:hypothetical protein
MRLRRSAPALLGAVLLLAACGEDAPEFGATPQDTAPPATTEEPSSYEVGETAAGLIGTTAPPTTAAVATTESSTTPVPPTSTAVPTPPDPAVQAICDRVSIFLVTASGLGPSPSSADAQMLHDSVSQLLDDGALLYSVLTPEDQARMTDCLNQAVQAAP